MSGTHYTQAQHRAAMKYWFNEVLPNGWTRVKASKESKAHLGFHVPESTLGLWARKYRKHSTTGRKVRISRPGNSTVPTDEASILSELQKINMTLEKIETRKWWELW